MKKGFLVLAIAATLAVSATPAFLQETGKPDAQREHGKTGGTVPQGGMMCPMMGSGNMGMGGAMGGMTGGMSGDPKMMGRMMQMRGEMMMKMGEVMMRHGKQMQEQNQQ